MKDVISYYEWIEKYRRGDFNTNNITEAGWFDWFCKDTALYTRFKRIAPKVLWFGLQGVVDLEKTYILLKNNCPMVGTLYDDFRVCDIKTGDVIFTVISKSGHRVDKGEASLWGVTNKDEDDFIVLFSAKNWIKLKEKILSNIRYLQGLYLDYINNKLIKKGGVK